MTRQKNQLTLNLRLGNNPVFPGRERVASRYLEAETEQGLADLTIPWVLTALGYDHPMVQAAVLADYVNRTLPMSLRSMLAGMVTYGLGYEIVLNQTGPDEAERGMALVDGKYPPVRTAVDLGPPAPKPGPGMSAPSRTPSGLWLP